MSGELTRVERRKAKSGSVDYAPKVILRETSRTRLEALAYFIPHRDHATEFQLKLEAFVKSSKKGGWAPDEKKTINITEEGSRELLRFLLTHLPVAAREPGEYVAIPLGGNASADLKGHSAESVTAALMHVLAQPELASHLASTSLPEAFISAVRGSIRLSEMRSAVAELRQYLDGGVVTEQSYQDWCDQHCWAFGNAYVVRDDVRAISAGDKLDLLLPKVIAGYRDLVELKRPDKAVLNYDDAHRNHYFSADVSKAIGQCHRYLDVLHQAAEYGLRDHKEIVAYHPRATIVIGRSEHWSDEEERALHGLNGRLHGISVMTYDHLLAQGERLLEMLDPRLEDSDDEIPW